MKKYTLDIKEVCSYFDVSEKTVRRWIKAKKIDFKQEKTRAGFTYKFHIPDFEGGQEAGQMSSPGDGHSPGQEAGQNVQGIISFLQGQIEEKDRQIQEKDRQIQEKDDQIKNYFSTLERMTHQGEILTMITQGISPKELLKDGQEAGQEAGQMSSPGDGHSSGQTWTKEEVLSFINKELSDRMTYRQIAQSLNENGIKTLKNSRNFYWNREMVKKLYQRRWKEIAYTVFKDIQRNWGEKNPPEKIRDRGAGQKRDQGIRESQ